MKPLALVVENDANTRKLLDVLLSRLGFETDLAPNATDALVFLRAVRYDIVFCDLLIPGTNGFDVLRRIEDEQPELLPRTVVLSGAAEHFLDRVRSEWPRVRVIRKPFDLDEVMHVSHLLTTGRVPQERLVNEVFARRSIRAGAKAGVALRANGSLADPLFAFGYEAGVFETIFPIHLDSDSPIALTVRQARPVWLASAATAAPDYLALAPLWAQFESRALAAVPLMHAGNAIGAVGWTFREPRVFSGSEQENFLSIAQTVAEWMADESRPLPQNDSSLPPARA